MGLSNIFNKNRAKNDNIVIRINIEQISFKIIVAGGFEIPFVGSIIKNGIVWATKFSLIESKIINKINNFSLFNVKPNISKIRCENVKEEGIDMKVEIEIAKLELSSFLEKLTSSKEFDEAIEDETVRKLIKMLTEVPESEMLRLLKFLFSFINDNGLSQKSIDILCEKWPILKSLDIKLGDIDLIY